MPRIPRGKGFKITNAQLFKIILTAAVLVMLVVVQRPCADSVSKFVTSFDDQGSDAAKMPKPGTVDVQQPQHYELLNGDMTEAQLKAAIERERARAAAARAGAGSGAAGSGAAGSGSALPR